MYLTNTPWPDLSPSQHSNLPTSVLRSVQLACQSASLALLTRETAVSQIPHMEQLLFGQHSLRLHW